MARVIVGEVVGVAASPAVRWKTIVFTFLLTSRRSVHICAFAVDFRWICVNARMRQLSDAVKDGAM